VDGGLPPLAASLLDASTLTLVAAPALWYLVVRPLRRLFEARGRLLELLFDSQEQERARIARDLHDSVGQQLTALMVGLRTVAEAADIETARGRVAALRELASAAHGEVRRLAHGLRPALLEELGLASALERLCQDFERSHSVKTLLRCDTVTAARLPRASEAALYRMAQEALTNVARHAGARQVEVALEQDDGFLHLTIHDDGRGFEAEPADVPKQRQGGFGLGSIRERTVLLDGELKVKTSPGKGTTVAIRVPVGG